MKPEANVSSEIVRTRRYKQTSVAWGFVAIPLFAVSAVLAFAGEMRSTFVALGLGAAVVTFAIRSLSMRRTHLEFQDGVLTFKGLVRDRALNEPGAPGRVVEVTLSGVAQADGQIWIGSLDQVMLMTAAWDDNVLTDLAHRLGWEIVREADQPSLPELAKRYPGVVPWYAAHPNLAAAVVLATCLVVFVPFTV